MVPRMLHLLIWCSESALRMSRFAWFVAVLYGDVSRVWRECVFVSLNGQSSVILSPLSGTVDFWEGSYIFGMEALETPASAHLELASCTPLT